MPTKFQIAIDCADPAGMARFWTTALGYEVEPPPAGFDGWAAYWRSIGLPEDEVEDTGDSIVDPTGAGPRIFFQQVPERKAAKNRLHFDLGVSGGAGVPLDARRERVDREAQRLVGAGATMVRVLSREGLDHYAVAMLDPEGNEFDVN